MPFLWLAQKSRLANITFTQEEMTVIIEAIKIQHPEELMKMNQKMKLMQRVNNMAGAGMLHRQHLLRTASFKSRTFDSSFRNASEGHTVFLQDP
ncbi:MAG: hypothetical protein ACLUOI_25630 [Eisenbergiella sp.]